MEPETALRCEISGLERHHWMLRDLHDKPSPEARLPYFTRTAREIHMCNSAWVPVGN